MTIPLGYKGSTYYARDVRYWLRSRSDGFVYESSGDPADLTPNEELGIWDREERRWLAHKAERDEA